MLVIAIIGVMVAVVVPRALRANVDTKYNMVRQTAAEIGKWGLTWAERNLKIQDEADTSDLNDYVGTLVGYTGDSAGTNWVSAAVAVPNRTGLPPNGVFEIMPQEKQPKNAFNGVSYFEATHDGNTVTPGLLYLATLSETVGGTTYDHYYFLYMGTESTAAAEWHAGMGSGTTSPGLTMNNLRNGVFMARLAQ